jgi:hypothetical protein
MKVNNISKKRILYPLLFIVLAGIIVFNIVRIASATGNDRVIAYKVPGGWGYQISHNDKVLIDQPFIPLLEGKIAFPDKKSALKTGNTVLKRLKLRQLPTLTIDDLQKFGLDTLVSR